MVALKALAWFTAGISLPDATSLEAVSLAELREVVGRLVGDVRRLRLDNAALQAKVDAQQATITALVLRTRRYETR